MFIKNFYGKTKDGKDVFIFENENKNGMKVKIINFGGIITSVIMPDKNGEMRDVVLGCDTLEDYENNGCYFGALIGRNGNRIAKSRFTIGDKEYVLSANEKGNQLHGGIVGFNKKVWDFEVKEDNLYLYYTSPDGEEGFPGTLKVIVVYTLTDENELVISYEAVSDKDTVVNLTNHSYFNLNGDNSGTVLNHKLKINADFITPVDDELIPLGELLPVDNTPFDFREYHTIGERINADDEQIKLGGGYDHNFFAGLTDELYTIASAEGDKSGITLDIVTDCEAVQLYTANGTDESGKNKAHYGKNSAFCLETQACPDAINQKKFPTTLLPAGDVYERTTIFKFDVK